MPSFVVKSIQSTCDPLSPHLCRSFCMYSRPTVRPDSDGERKEKKKQFRASDLVRKWYPKHCPVVLVMKRKNVTRTSDLSLNGKKKRPPVISKLCDTPTKCQCRFCQSINPLALNNEPVSPPPLPRQIVENCSTSLSSSREERPTSPSTRSVLTVFMVPNCPTLHGFHRPFQFPQAWVCLSTAWEHSRMRFFRVRQERFPSWCTNWTSSFAPFRGVGFFIADTHR